MPVMMMKIKQGTVTEGMQEDSCWRVRTDLPEEVTLDQ